MHPLFFTNKYLISFNEDEDTGLSKFDASSKFEELIARVRRKEFKKRTCGRLSFFIGNNTEIAVKLYERKRNRKV